MSLRRTLTDLAFDSLAYRGYAAIRSAFRRTLLCPLKQRIVLDGVELDLAPHSAQMREYIVYGQYELAERNLSRRHLRKDDRVLELGGGIGLIGMFCKKQLSISDYFTIEANPKTLALLQKNYELNSLSADALGAAIGGFDGKIALQIGEEFWKDSISSSSSRNATIEVPCFTLKTLLSRLPFVPTALIIDVEGAENEIAWADVPKEVRVVLMEMHPKTLGVTAFYRIIAEIIAQGFIVAERVNDVFAFVRK